MQKGTEVDIVAEFPGTFFKADDLAGKRLPLIIERVEKTEMNDGKIKPVLYGEGDARGLVLNVENRLELVDRFGRDTSGWVGKKIVLITRRVQGPNGPCQGIRLADRLDDELPDSAETAPKPRKANFK
jgi:hypothetical protein